VSGLGRGRIGAQPKADRSKLDEGEVVGSELVITGDDTPALLDLVEEPLHQVTRSVEVGTEAANAGLLQCRRRSAIGTSFVEEAISFILSLYHGGCGWSRFGNTFSC
jgi:hypothetical protein